jgi:hypothetical protein
MFSFFHLNIFPLIYFHAASAARDAVFAFDRAAASRYCHGERVPALGKLLGRK